MNQTAKDAIDTVPSPMVVRHDLARAVRRADLLRRLLRLAERKATELSTVTQADWAENRHRDGGGANA